MDVQLRFTIKNTDVILSREYEVRKDILSSDCIYNILNDFDNFILIHCDYINKLVISAD
jgi:hypothetical protein